MCTWSDCCRFFLTGCSPVSLSKRRLLFLHCRAVMHILLSFSVAVEGLMGGHSGINIQEVSTWLDADCFSSTVERAQATFLCWLGLRLGAGWQVLSCVCC